jgi:hypothetical protein
VSDARASRTQSRMSGCSRSLGSSATAVSREVRIRGRRRRSREHAGDAVRVHEPTRRSVPPVPCSLPPHLA